MKYLTFYGHVAMLIKCFEGEGGGERERGREGERETDKMPNRIMKCLAA